MLKTTGIILQRKGWTYNSDTNEFTKHDSLKAIVDEKTNTINLFYDNSPSSSLTEAELALEDYPLIVYQFLTEW